MGATSESSCSAGILAAGFSASGAATGAPVVGVVADKEPSPGLAAGGVAVGGVAGGAGGGSFAACASATKSPGPRISAQQIAASVDRVRRRRVVRVSCPIGPPVWLQALRFYADGGRLEPRISATALSRPARPAGAGASAT